MKIICPQCGAKRDASQEYVNMKGTHIIMCRNCATIKTLTNKQIKISNAGKQVELNGCTLVKMPEGRCQPYDDCPFYLDCLHTVADLSWEGWNTL